MEFVIYGLLGLALLIIVLSVMAPMRVSYTKDITVDAPVAQVYDDIRLQEHLMRWSAWPQETKSSCALEGTDGQVGARTVFFTKGKRVGHQEVAHLKENEEVALSLIGPGPPHRPRLTFDFRAVDANKTKVMLYFINELRRPFNAIWRFAGLTKWTRQMHLKDLKRPAGICRTAAPRHERTPPWSSASGAKPYEHRGQAA